MLGIHPEVMCHQLSIDPTYNTIAQRKRKIGGEKEQAIVEEVGKFLNVRLIPRIKYPTWLSKKVMVIKKIGKWRMCVDFKDLNKDFQKDLYPLPHIDRLIDNS